MIDHWDDILSDLSAFHRVNPAEPEATLDTWSSQTLFSIIQRLPHYRGVMRDRVLTAQDTQQTRQSPVGAPPGTTAQAPVPLPSARAGGGLPPALAQFVDR